MRRLGSRTEALELISKIEKGFKPRPVSSPFDWGDDETVGLSVKRKIRRGMALPKLNESFGYWLGSLNGEHFIGFKDAAGNITHCVAYDSVQEMKYDWRLD